jgi:hypothetical protein
MQSVISVGTWNLENLFRPGGTFGPKDKIVYDGKLAGLAATINAAAPDVLGVQEVGDPGALADLVTLLDGEWHTALSTHFGADHPIRVGVLARHPVQVLADTTAFVPPLRPIQGDDTAAAIGTMGRGVLAVDVAVLSRVTEVHALHDRPLPSVGNDPGPRRDAEDSDHAPIVAHLDV